MSAALSFGTRSFTGEVAPLCDRSRERDLLVTALGVRRLHLLLPTYDHDETCFAVGHVELAFFSYPCPTNWTGNRQYFLSGTFPHGLRWSVSVVKTVHYRSAFSVTAQRIGGTVMAAFAGFALLLAVLGLFGAIACAVGERTQEIGIRMALGAERKEVFRVVVGQGMPAALI